MVTGDFDRVDAEYDADDANCQVVTSSDWSTIAIFRLFNTLRPATLVKLSEISEKIEAHRQRLF